MMQEQFQDYHDRGGNSGRTTTMMCTNMEQSMYTPNKYPRCTTDMEQDMFQTDVLSQFGTTVSAMNSQFGTTVSAMNQSMFINKPTPPPNNSVDKYNGFIKNHR